MNSYYAFAVVSAWSCSPVFRRAALNAMGEGSAATFVVYNTILCSVVGMAIAFSDREKMYRDIDKGGWRAFFFVLSSACLALSAGYFLSKLVAENNPGVVMAQLNGCANIAGYIVGTLFYGNFTLSGIGGALLIATGIYVLKLE